MKIDFHPKAVVELEEARDYYEHQRAGLGRDFEQTFWEGLNRIEDFPLAWQILGTNIRRYRLNRFPYGVIYKPSRELIHVLSVAHLHRRPGHWRGRK